jgi:hypothetical protein
VRALPQLFYYLHEQHVLAILLRGDRSLAIKHLRTALAPLSIHR